MPLVRLHLVTTVAAYTPTDVLVTPQVDVNGVALSYHRLRTALACNAPRVVEDDARESISFSVGEQHDEPARVDKVAASAAVRTAVAEQNTCLLSTSS
jgi:hypothetical protein